MNMRKDKDEKQAYQVIDVFEKYLITCIIGTHTI